MTRRPPLWPGPVEAGARAVATGHLDDAAAALVRVAQGTDAEALHDFRVALRRLRSALRAYRDALDPKLTPAALEHTRALASRTGAARDAEAQLEWLRTLLVRLRGAPRSAAEFVIRDLESVIVRSQVGLASALARDFAALDAELRPALATYSAPVSGIGPLPGRSFGEVSAELLCGALEHLFAMLAQVHSERDEEPAHRARIDAKRLRYLLEPFERERPGVGAPLLRMRRLQDVLGELNDLRALRANLARALEQTVLAEAQRRLGALESGAEDAPRRVASRALEAGLLSLAGRVRARRRALFARFAGQWLGEAARERALLATEIGALSTRLAKRKAGL